ncbi:acyl-CoA synthetase [Rhodococcus tukisamuensis]|uniref:Fatty-acyl-CoA synthase n=1 Tax=Rhodococcus tukisamuensis TaxID=168276 RepID=A0A1G6YX25_9NOCA|nr:long-chain fatty acid--CoA ligase [Rhodococcus tukisamuensis]SDD94890.1 fatty-acyl-CoA synthase [Rhodococcus tukisamuensis]
MDNGIGNWPSIHHLRRPDRTALVDADTGAALTFGELDRRTNALADAMRQRGVRKGDRVALITFNSPHMLEVLFAAAKLGAVTVPVNYRLSAPEMRYILQDSGACIVFHSAQLTATVHDAADGTYVRETVEIGSAAQRVAGERSAYDALLASGDPARVEYDIGHDDLCVVMYTSGTTGRPKGAMLTHGNFLWNAVHNFSIAEGLTPRDVNVTSAPMFHIGALGIFTLPMLYLGATSVILESFAPEAWLDAVEQHRGTVAFCVPAMWAAIDNAASIGDRDLGSLKFTISGGAPCPVVLIEALRGRGITFTEGFGLTETSPIAAVLDADDVVTHAGSIGRPVLHVDFRIVDDGRDVPVGEVGELVMRGPNIFAGYWQKPDATREALRDGWFHSGDLARCDEDGYYTIVDRKKDMVISGGENVYPAEVEQQLYRHRAVAEVAVIGVPDETWGEAVAAVVVCKPGQQVGGDELISWLRERLAHFKCPRAVVFVDELPRTATGKILKRELRANWSDGAMVAAR